MSKLRCTEDELPDLPPPWHWERVRGPGWCACSERDHEGGDRLVVEATLVGDDGIHILVSFGNKLAYAPLIVILAVAVANGVLDDVHLPSNVQQAQTIRALSQRCADLVRESASFEARWREVGEQYAAERTRRHSLEVALLAYIEDIGYTPTLDCQDVASGLRELLRASSEHARLVALLSNEGTET